MAYSGSLTNDQDTVVQQISGMENSALVQITGTFSLTVLFEASADNTTWVAVQGVSGSTVATSTTVVGNWLVNISGYSYFRLRSHPITSGTATVQFSFSVGTVNVLATPATAPAALGQTTMSASTPVAIASDQSNLPANIKQINGSTISIGSAASAASLPVVIASDQGAFVVNPVAPTENTYLTSAGRTTTQTQADQTNTVFKGICVIVDVTVIGTGNITAEIDAKDPTSGKYYVLLTGAAISSNSTNTYTVYPSIATVANVSSSQVLPKTYRIKVTANNANSVTYTVGYNLLP